MINPILAATGGHIPCRTPLSISVSGLLDLCGAIGSGVIWRLPPENMVFVDGDLDNNIIHDVITEVFNK